MSEAGKCEFVVRKATWGPYLSLVIDPIHFAKLNPAIYLQYHSQLIVPLYCSVKYTQFSMLFSCIAIFIQFIKLFHVVKCHLKVKLYKIWQKKLLEEIHYIFQVQYLQFIKLYCNDI